MFDAFATALTEEKTEVSRVSRVPKAPKCSKCLDTGCYPAPDFDVYVECECQV
jgi:hypothetical protein